MHGDVRNPAVHYVVVAIWPAALVLHLAPDVFVVPVQGAAVRLAAVVAAEQDVVVRHYFVVVFPNAVVRCAAVRRAVPAAGFQDAVLPYVAVVEVPALYVEPDVVVLVTHVAVDQAGAAAGVAVLNAVAPPAVFDVRLVALDAALLVAVDRSFFFEFQIVAIDFDLPAAQTLSSGLMHQNLRSCFY